MDSVDVWIFFLVAAGLVGAAFALSWALCGAARRLAPRLGLVDRPGGHKGHRVPTPLGGGLVIGLTTIGILGVGMLVVKLDGALLPEPLARHVSGALLRLGTLIEILTLASAIMAMGLIDDIKNLDWRLRLGI